MVKPRAEGQKLDMSFSWTEVNYAQYSSCLWILEDVVLWQTGWHSWGIHVGPQIAALIGSLGTRALGKALELILSQMGKRLHRGDPHSRGSWFQTWTL